MQRFFSAFALALAGSMFIAQAAIAEEAKPETFGDWGYQCEKAPDGNQFCYVFQNVTKKEGGQLVLGARVAFRPEQTDPLLVVTVPLGTLLPPGAALDISRLRFMPLPLRC